MENDGRMYYCAQIMVLFLLIRYENRARGIKPCWCSTTGTSSQQFLSAPVRSTLFCMYVYSNHLNVYDKEIKVDAKRRKCRVVHTRCHIISYPQMVCALLLFRGFVDNTGLLPVHFISWAVTHRGSLSDWAITSGLCPQWPPLTLLPASYPLSSLSWLIYLSSFSIPFFKSQLRPHFYLSLFINHLLILSQLSFPNLSLFQLDPTTPFYPRCKIRNRC